MFDGRWLPSNDARCDNAMLDVFNDGMLIIKESNDDRSHAPQTRGTRYVHFAKQFDTRAHC